MKVQLWIVVVSILILEGCVSNTTSSDKVKPNTKSSDMFQSVELEKTTMLQSGEKRLFCSKCGMKLPMFYKTNHSATSDGKVKQYCSIHCLAEDKSIHKHNVTNMKVVAIDTLKFIDVKDATYVVGSEKAGTMSGLSKYAFEGRMSARRFAKENQGTVVNFDKAYAYALKDFLTK